MDHENLNLTGGKRSASCVTDSGSGVTSDTHSYRIIKNGRIKSLRGGSSSPTGHTRSAYTCGGDKEYVAIYATHTALKNGNRESFL